MTIYLFIYLFIIHTIIVIVYKDQNVKSNTYHVIPINVFILVRAYL